MAEYSTTKNRENNFTTCWPLYLLDDLLGLPGLPPFPNTHNCHDYSTNACSFTIHLGSGIDRGGIEQFREIWEAFYQATSFYASHPKPGRVLMRRRNPATVALSM